MTLALMVVACSPRIARAVCLEAPTSTPGLDDGERSYRIPPSGERRAERTDEKPVPQKPARVQPRAPSQADSPPAAHTASRRAEDRQPTYLKIRLLATPKNHRAPPA